MRDSNAVYQSLVGLSQGAHRLHIHETELLRPEQGWGAQHSHVAEEALYMLEGEGEFTFAGKTHRVDRRCSFRRASRTRRRAFCPRR